MIGRGRTLRQVWSEISITSQNLQHWSLPSPTPSTFPVQQEKRTSATPTRTGRAPQKHWEPSCQRSARCLPPLHSARDQAESAGGWAQPSPGQWEELPPSPPCSSPAQAGEGSSWLERPPWRCTRPPFLSLEGMICSSWLSAGPNAEECVCVCVSPQAETPASQIHP